MGAAGHMCGTGESAVCTDLENDPLNCGACGHVCSTLDRCSGGSCVCGAGECTNLLRLMTPASAASAQQRRRNGRVTRGPSGREGEGEDHRPAVVCRPGHLPSNTVPTCAWHAGYAYCTTAFPQCQPFAGTQWKPLDSWCCADSEWVNECAPASDAYVSCHNQQCKRAQGRPMAAGEARQLCAFHAHEEEHPRFDVLTSIHSALRGTGWNYYGQTGDGGSGYGSDRTSPVIVSAGSNIDATTWVTAGDYHTCVATGYGATAALCWG